MGEIGLHIVEVANSDASFMESHRSWALLVASHAPTRGHRPWATGVRAVPFGIGVSHAPFLGHRPRMSGAQEVPPVVVFFCARIKNNMAILRSPRRSVGVAFRRGKRLDGRVLPDANIARHSHRQVIGGAIPHPVSMRWAIVFRSNISPPHTIRSYRPDIIDVAEQCPTADSSRWAKLI